MLLITCPFGLSSILWKELKLLWYNPQNTFPTWTFVDWNNSAIYDINLRSRIANKVYLLIWQSHTQTFDQLFDFVYWLDFWPYIQSWQKISISANSQTSILTSIPSIQSISQKAIIKKLLSLQNSCNSDLSDESEWSECHPEQSEGYKKEWDYILRSRSEWQGDWEVLQIDPDKADFEIFIFLQDNLCKIFVNTSWISLHNRWYRQQALDAPIKENVAAWLVLLSWRKFWQAFYDPFCWSWTICIEAAMIAKNIPVWLKRFFAFQDFPNFDAKLFQTIKDQAVSKIFTEKQYKIFWSDIDPLAVKVSRQNAINAGVDDTITFSQQDFLSSEISSWHIVSNPPYGKRLQDFDLNKIYSHIDKLFSSPDLTWWIITSYDGFQNMIDKTKYSSKTIFNWADKCAFWKKA
jgi:putative N6-adenine-specific DNA methylase